MAAGQEYLLQIPSIPEYPNYVMFDLEGLPPQLDELEKVYLWGLQVFGERPGEFQAATAGFGVEGDRQGWEEFLWKARGIFEEYGDLPFVHWHHYERVRLDMYVERFGDRDGVADRVRKNLLDLLPITQRSIALPLPSYSLKVLERYIGFKRSQKEYGGDWAMAKYIEATETEDEKLRKEVLKQILIYNREDLEATWAVLKWLKQKSRDIHHDACVGDIRWSTSAESDWMSPGGKPPSVPALESMSHLDLDQWKSVPLLFGIA